MGAVIESELYGIIGFHILLLMMDSDTDKQDRGLDLFGDTHNCDEDKEEVLQPHESPDEPHKMIKYNLRKSLAWDKAFFTNAGKFFAVVMDSVVCIV